MGQLDLVCDLKTIRRLNIMYDRHPLSIIESLIVDEKCASLDTNNSLYELQDIGGKKIAIS